MEFENEKENRRDSFLRNSSKKRKEGHRPNAEKIERKPRMEPYVRPRGKVEYNVEED